MLETIIEEILKIEHRPVIIAIDGRCAAGKSTLALLLSEQLHATIFHLDDFYLQGRQRTYARLNEVGGNVDYERFAKEVIKPILQGKKVRYRTFNHHTYKPHKYGYEITPKAYIIIEGSYSMHPYFGDYYDLGIFCDVDPITQMKRIENREGPEKAKMFQSLWIPKEEAYFKKYQIAKGKIHYVYRDLSETREND